MIKALLTNGGHIQSHTAKRSGIMPTNTGQAAKRGMTSRSSITSKKKAGFTK